MTTNFGEQAYWEERYGRADTNFDWYCTYPALRQFIVPLITPESRILVVGCGNSRLSAALYDDGYQHVVSVDVSETVIEQMKRKYSDRPGLEFIAMDVRLLDLPSESFDLVLDKATLDTLLCGPQSFSKVAMATKEIWRVLRPTGYYMCISSGAPDVRVPHLQGQTLHWDLEHRQLPKSTAETATDSGPSAFYHIYLMRKHAGPRAPVVDDDDA